MSGTTHICNRCYHLFHKGEVYTVGMLFLKGVATCALCHEDLDTNNYNCVSPQSVERISDALDKLIYGRVISNPKKG